MADESVKTVQARFFTQLEESYKVPFSSIAIPSNVTRLGLSSVVNSLLDSIDSDREAEPFDFLIDGELIRMSLEEFLLAKGVSAEKILDIEYIKAVAPRKQEEPSLHDDWVSAVEGSHPGVILTGSYDRFGRVWNGAGTCSHMLGGHKDALTSLCVITTTGMSLETLYPIIMASLPTVTEVKVEDYVFPPTVKPPGSDKSFFLAGAGVRGMELGGKFVKFTAIGVYMEESAVPELSIKWTGKSAAHLADSPEFFRDIVTGGFETFTQVTMILPLTGEQYSDKVTENCVKFWKAVGIYTDEEAKAVEKFLEVFKDENFPPGHSIMFTRSPLGSLTVAFSKHETIPEAGKAVIENKNMSEAVLESIIGKHGVSPEAKQSLAARVSALLNDEKAGGGDAAAAAAATNGTAEVIAPENVTA